MVGMRPGNIIAVFDEIAEPIPLDFPAGEGAVQFHLPIAQADNLPVPAARAVLDVYFLPDVKCI
jgi:hypothetical protein